MRKIIYLLVYIMLTSCASKKQVTNETKSIYRQIDSVEQAINASDEITISWSFDSVFPGVKNDSSLIPSWAKPYLTAMDKPPKSGIITIKRSRSTDILNKNIKTKEKTKLKKKDSTKEPTKVLKSEKTKNRLNAIYIIIFAIFIKFVFDQRKNLKNFWSKLQKYLSLHRH